MVFVPTAIHPFTGFLAFVPQPQLRPINLPPEDAIKMECTAGLFKPETGWLQSPKDYGLRPMPVLDHLKIRLARPEDAATIVSFSAAMALETEGRRLDLNRLYLGTIALLESPNRGFFMVAELERADDRQLLGQLMITYEWSDWRNGAFGGFRVCMLTPPGVARASFAGCMKPDGRRQDKPERLRGPSVR